MQILHYIITLSHNKLRFIIAYLMNQIEVLLLLNKTNSVRVLRAMMLDIKFPNWKFQKAGFIAKSVTKELDFWNDSFKSTLLNILNAF